MTDSEQYPPPPPPPPPEEPTRKRRRRWPWVAGAIAVVVVVAAVVAGGADEDEGPRLAETEETTTTTAADEEESTTASTEATTTTVERTDFVVGDRVETAAGNFVQVFSYEQPVPPPDEFFTPEPGNEFAVMDVESCAGPTDDPDGLRSANPFDFELQMPDNTRRQSDISVREPALNYVDLPRAGDCARGWVTFQVPAGQKPSYIEHIFTDPKVRWTIP